MSEESSALQQQQLKDQIEELIELKDVEQLRSILEAASKRDDQNNKVIVENGFMKLADLLAETGQDLQIDETNVKQAADQTQIKEIVLSPDEQQTLDNLDAEVDSLSEEGDELKTMEAMEMALLFRRKKFGLHSQQTYSYREKVAKAYNRLSVIMMNQQELKMAADLLEKAQILGELFPEVMAVTYNNLGCYYRMKGRNRTALNYLKEALNVENTLADSPINISDTHLNLCAIYSDLKRHKDAYYHISLAIRHLQVEIFGRHLDPREDPTVVEAKEGVDKVRLEVFTTAVFNLAVQLEFLEKWEKSQITYEVSKLLVQTYKLEGPLKTTILAATRKAESKLRRKLLKQRNVHASRAERAKILHLSKKRAPKSTDSQARSPVRNTAAMSSEMEARLRSWSMYTATLRK